MARVQPSWAPIGHRINYGGGVSLRVRQRATTRSLNQMQFAFKVTLKDLLAAGDVDHSPPCDRSTPEYHSVYPQVA
jgi:hypothetical protein